MTDEKQADQGKLTPEGASASGESALGKAWSYLERAEAWLLQQTTLAPGPEHATAAAAVGTGYAVLAQFERRDPVPSMVVSVPDAVSPTFLEHLRREVRRHVEARPHDDEPARAPEHSADCEGCDAPGVVPCSADEVRDGLAYRDGFPIKDLRPEARRG